MPSPMVADEVVEAWWRDFETFANRALQEPLDGIFLILHGAMASPPRYPPLTEELRHHLSEYYREDVERLGTMIGRDLGRWLSVESSVAA